MKKENVRKSELTREKQRLLWEEFEAYKKSKEKERLLFLEDEMAKSKNPMELYRRKSLAIEFRKRFKACENMLGHNPSNYVNTYGFCIEREKVRKILEEGETLFDYILYIGGNLLITEQYMYELQNKEKYQLDGISEVTYYENRSECKIFVESSRDRKCIKANSRDYDQIAICILNMALSAWREKSYATKYDKLNNCCCFCNSDDIKAGGLFSWYCKSCHKKISMQDIYANPLDNLTGIRKSVFRNKSMEEIIGLCNDKALFKDEEEDLKFYQKLKDAAVDELSKKTVFCPYCGKQIMRAVKFCNYCGKENKYIVK